MNPEQQFGEILERMKASAHGSQELAELSDLLRGLKKQRKQFIADRFIEPAVSWDENRERGIWDDEAIAEKNKYWFLQGSLIESKHVVSPSGVAKHNDWLVLSADCDCARAKYINVGKVRQLTDSSDDKEILGIATALKTHKFFPIPPFSEHDHWSVVELEIPCFLERANYAALTRTAFWLSNDAWHILNAVLQAKHTRALNIEESEKLRVPV